MSSIEISRMDECTVEDAARLERLCFRSPWSLESLRAELENPLAVFLTAGIDGETAGYAGMHDVAGEGYVTNVAVSPEYRGRGVAKALMRSLLDYGVKNGLRFITLEVRESNGAARGLYRGLGFKEEGRRKNFYSLPAEDGIIMTRRLDLNANSGDLFQHDSKS